MNKILKRSLIILSFLLNIIFGIYLLVSWAFSYHEFQYGSFEYRLFVNSEMDELPIVGAEKRDVSYHSDPGDGPKPPMLSMNYTTRSNPKEILDVYKAHYKKLGYSFEPSYQLNSNSLKYKGKGSYEAVEIYVYHDEGPESAVTITYITKNY